MRYLYGEDIRKKYIPKYKEYFKNNPATLSVIEVGENAENKSYILGILKLASELGVKVEMHRIKIEVDSVIEDVTQIEDYKSKYSILSFDYIYTLPENLDKCIEVLMYNLGKRPEICGILLLSKMGYNLKYSEIANQIDPMKDVDCITDTNIRKLLEKDYKIAPCTPMAVITMLKENNIEISGKNCVVVGRSNVVGKPLGLMLMHEDATVTFCHSKTEDLKKYCRFSDILVSCVGKPNIITEDMYNQGTIIDVGINFVNGCIIGDVCKTFYSFDKGNVQNYTPVPGGIGPLTTLMLFKNLKTLMGERKGTNNE